MTRYAIVDLEATDASNSKDKIKKIIQIGIVIMENGKIVDSFASDVNPHEHLSDNISKLTGLRNRDLQKAPDFEALIPQILEILQDSIFVAHNVKFDWSLLYDHLLKFGVELDLPRVDTVELARVFFPTIEKYGLESLSNSLHLTNSHPHAALADAEETAELLLRIQQRILELPIAVLQEILRHADNFIYETRILLDELIWDCENRFSDFDLIGPIATLKTSESQSEAKLSSDFTANLKMLGLKKRKEQALLAKVISEDLAKSKPAFIEAQTGTGKTLAYLLPALATGRKVIVAPPTKILQGQIITELSPDLTKKFSVNSAKLSSPRNYISLERLRQQLHRNDAGKNTEIFKMKVLVWLTETKTGELSELSRNVTNQEMFDSLAHDGRLSELSVHITQDFWRKAQEKAASAHLIVTNQAYLIECLRNKSDLCKNAILVLDEAQRLFPILESAQEQSFNTIDEILKVEVSNFPEKKQQLHALMQLLDSTNFDRTRVCELADNLGLSNLLEFFSRPDRIYWSEEKGNLVKSSPHDFYDFKSMLPDGAKAIFISGSIAFSEKHPLLPELLGFDDYNFYKLPTKQKKNQRLLTVIDGPAVNNSSIHDYAQFLTDKLNELIQLKMPIVVLFNSREMLEAVAEQMSQINVSFVAQQKEQHDLLKKQFDSEKFQVMLATGAFWEGVDFDKQKRIILVIPRLPFATPDDILTRKFAVINAANEKKKSNTFYDFNLPMAVMKLRQAIGRVNRKPSQKSVVVVLDNRLEKARYAKRIKKNLEEILPTDSGEFTEVMQKIKEFIP